MGVVDCSFLSLQSTQLSQAIQIQMNIFIVIFNAICAVSIMIPSMAAGSVVTLFGSAPGSDDAGVILWSAKYAFSMKADQIPKIGLLLVFFLLKSLHFWDFS